MLLHNSIHREDNAEPVAIHRKSVVRIFHDVLPYLIGLFVFMYSVDYKYIVIVGEQVGMSTGEFVYSDFQFFFVVMRESVEHLHIERINERGMQMELPLSFDKISKITSIHQFLTNLETIAPNLMKYIPLLRSDTLTCVSPAITLTFIMTRPFISIISACPSASAAMLMTLLAGLG